MWVVSACLLGLSCRYDGQGKESQKVKEFLRDKPFLALCPEVLGGLSIPRVPAERREGRVINQCGQDVTDSFEMGAKEALRLATAAGASHGLFKEGSPSCGVHRIYDGSFSQRKMPGQGITTALLKGQGMVVISEEDL